MRRDELDGYPHFCFDKCAPSTKGDLGLWIEAQISKAPKGSWQKPETSSAVLASWFEEIRQTFSSLKDAEPDDLYGTEYNFYEHVIDAAFAGPVGEEGVVLAWKLADKFGLRIMVGDELLPPSAPAGKRNFHITALDGPENPKSLHGVTNLCIAVIDPQFAPQGDLKKWVVEQLSDAEGSKDSSTIETNRLRQWNDDFALRSADAKFDDVRFFRALVFARFQQGEMEKIVPVAMELSRKYRLPLLFFENM